LNDEYPERTAMNDYPFYYVVIVLSRTFCHRHD